MLKLKSKTERVPWRVGMPRLPKLPHIPRVVWVLLVLLLALVAEGLRGHWVLKKWTEEMAAKGEVFDVNQLWPAVTPRSVEFSNQLTHAIRKLSPLLGNYSVDVAGIVPVESGVGRRGSQEPFPSCEYFQRPSNSWEDLDHLLQQSQPALQAMRELLKDPPPAMGDDIRQILKEDSYANMVNSRLGAQAFHAATVNDLHHGDLAAAVQDLGALMAFAKLYDQDPSLGNYMISIAITGLSADAFWDALQADGWTEPQLAALQRECLDTSRFLDRLPRTLEAERAFRMYQYHWFRTHSYQSLYNRFEKVYAGFGVIPGDNYQAWMRAHAKQPWLSAYSRMTARLGWKPPTETVAPWRQWLSHPAWSIAWTDEEELEYLKRLQPDLEVLREASRHPSWRLINKKTTANHNRMADPVAAWRFYQQLPFDYPFDNRPKPRESSYTPYSFTVYSNLWFLSLKNLTIHQMVKTAIALKRYELIHGKNPASLAALTPDLLPSVPTDFMDDQPLHYRLNADNSYTLYSIGHNLLDDGGDPLPEYADNEHHDLPPWNGEDWVWPRAVVAAKNPPAAASILQTRGH